MRVDQFFSRRKVVYPFFVIIFAFIIFSMVFLVSLSQSLVASDVSFSVSGEYVVLKMTIENTSNHTVDDPEVILVYGGEKKSIKVKSKDNFLAPGEKYDLVASIPLSESTQYEVFLVAPFNRTLRYDFSLDSSTLEPVNAVVNINSNMIVGTKYDVSVRLCNVSDSSLYNVEWTESVNGSFFEESLVPRQVSLSANECKNLYSTLTPVRSGKASLSFSLKVGEIIKKYSHEVNISNE